jgi:hypothetical protein
VRSGAALARLLAGFLVLALACGAQAQDYTYIQQSLRVPWTLYFIFLLLVLLPFVVAIALAWRQHLRQEEKPKAE